MAYDLKPVSAPKLRGLGLRLSTALIENALFRPLLLPGLFRKTGAKSFRKLTPTAAPTLYPLVKGHDGPRCESDQASVVEAIVRESPTYRGSGFRHVSLDDYLQAYRNGSVSPEDVGQHLIDAVDDSNRCQPPLRAIIKCDAGDIARQAADSTERLAQGQPRSILEGVPVAIKDEMDMLPYTTHVGTRFLGTGVPGEDATPVARLRAAGALLIGKANMFEIGISPTGNNPIHGFARNPHNPEHDTGGSSSGCGGAVGSGLVPLAIGTDGGGSIRVPAAHCGVVGLKPTFGRVSEFGAAPLCWSVAHIGPLGATALDCAIGYALCAGPDEKDPMTREQPPVHLRDFHNLDLSGVTLGIYEPWFEDASPEIVRCCEETARLLEQAGASRKKIEIEGLEATRVAHAITILSEMAAAMDQYHEEHRKDFSHAVRLNLALARQFTNLDYLRAQRIRTESMREWQRAFREVDVVLTPTTACPPPFLDPRTVSHGESDMGTMTELMRFVVPANFCGLPAISIPAGYTRKGLPVGLQAIGRHWDEALLLRLANVVDHLLERRKPAVIYEPLPRGKG